MAKWTAGFLVLRTLPVHTIRPRTIVEVRAAMPALIPLWLGRHLCMGLGLGLSDCFARAYLPKFTLQAVCGANMLPTVTNRKT